MNVVIVEPSKNFGSYLCKLVRAKGDSCQLFLAEPTSEDLTRIPAGSRFLVNACLRAPRLAFSGTRWIIDQLRIESKRPDPVVAHSFLAWEQFMAYPVNAIFANPTHGYLGTLDLEQMYSSLMKTEAIRNERDLRTILARHTNRQALLSVALQYFQHAWDKRNHRTALAALKRLEFLLPAGERGRLNVLCKEVSKGVWNPKRRKDLERIIKICES